MYAEAATSSLVSENTWDATVASPMGPLRWKDKGSEGTGLQRGCLAPINASLRTERPLMDSPTVVVDVLLRHKAWRAGMCKACIKKDLSFYNIVCLFRDLYGLRSGGDLFTMSHGEPTNGLK